MRRARQQGLALITVLLIMALVVMLVAGMLRSHQLLIASVSQQSETSRGLQVLMAAEHRALGLLRERLAEDMRVIHDAQPWAQPQLFSLGDVRLRVQVEDLAARFNLAALTRSREPDPVLFARWQRLCDALGVAPPDLAALHGQPFFDVSQLRELPDVDAKVLERLRPWVTVLPVQAGLNINTANGQVLAALEGVTPAAGRQLVEARPKDGHASVREFLQDPLLGEVASARGLTVGSRWFGVNLQADLEGQRMHLYSEVEMDFDTKRLRVLRRAFSTVRQAGVE
ncbi:general secretion pathway protein GspK [Pseudomonas sp. NPDC089554]|uniref:general secretion pathway protein GspK n=1 Tax=Pseudomonas sp. NPDC089554 TaxID=3390653 RepID=UPI003D055749